MNLATVTSDSKSDQGLTVKTSIRDFELTNDEPSDMGGEDQGPTPMEMILAGLGSCLCIMSKMTAKKLKLNLESVSVHLEGDFDRKAVGGARNAKPGFQNIRADIDLNGELSEEEKTKIMNKVEQTCPVTDTLKSGTEININIK